MDQHSSYSALFIPWDVNKDIEVVDVPYNVNSFDHQDLWIERKEINYRKDLYEGDIYMVKSLILFDSNHPENNPRASFLKFDHIRGDAYLVWVQCTTNEDGEIVSSYNYYRAFIEKDYEEILRKLLLERKIIGYYYLHLRGDNIFKLDRETKINPFPEEYIPKKWKGISPKGILDTFLNSSKENKAIKKEYFTYETSKNEKGNYLFKMGLKLSYDDGNENFVREYITDNYYTSKSIGEHNAALKFLKILHANNVEDLLGIKLVEDEGYETDNIPYPYPSEILNTYNNEFYCKLRDDKNVKPIDILNNGHIIKYIIKEGEGKYVPFTGICKLYRRILKISYFDDGHYKSVDHSDLIFRGKKNENNVSGSEELTPIEYGGEYVDIGKKSNEKLWNLLLPSMKLGEIALVYLKGKEDEDVVDTEKPKFIYYLLMVEIPNHKKSINYSIGKGLKKVKGIEEKIKVGKKYKEDGNQFFNRGLFKLAYDNYKKGILTISISNPYKKENALINDEYILLKHQLYMNLALSCMKMDKWIEMNDSFGKYDEALRHLNVVIEEDDKNTKAIIRRSRVYAYLLEIEKAYEDLERALMIDPNIDENVINETRDIIKKQSIKRDGKERSMYKKIRK